MATGAPPAIAVSGAAAEMTKNATPEVPNVACRSWCSVVPVRPSRPYRYRCSARSSSP